MLQKGKETQEICRCREGVVVARRGVGVVSWTIVGVVGGSGEPEMQQGLNCRQPCQIQIFLAATQAGGQSQLIQLTDRALSAGRGGRAGDLLSPSQLRDGHLPDVYSVSA